MGPEGEWWWVGECVGGEREEERGERRRRIQGYKDVIFADDV